MLSIYIDFGIYFQMKQIRTQTHTRLISVQAYRMESPRTSHTATNSTKNEQRSVGKEEEETEYEEDEHGAVGWWGDHALCYYCTPVRLVYMPKL